MIHRTVDNLKANAPEGFTPYVYVTLYDGETFKPGNVQYIGPWLIFEMDRPGDELTPERRVIAVHPERIGHVEIRFERSTRSDVGFTVLPPGD